MCLGMQAFQLLIREIEWPLHTIKQKKALSDGIGLYIKVTKIIIILHCCRVADPRRYLRACFQCLPHPCTV